MDFQLDTRTVQALISVARRSPNRSETIFENGRPVAIVTALDGPRFLDSDSPFPDWRRPTRLATPKRKLSKRQRDAIKRERLSGRRAKH